MNAVTLTSLSGRYNLSKRVACVFVVQSMYVRVITEYYQFFTYSYLTVVGAEALG
ncbi:hypothetical protein [Schleiferia thermophila]|jgi:predicted nuclease of restriction endonuclease-like RecB superfamily|uniref:hypothetical protein n=1 Tax=Schleiferia thermophila TaxID=884107 RepID=UPI00136267F6|nr:hypothetical protein [Schleiferia thermophila]